MKLEHIDTSTTAGKAEVMRLAAEGRTVAMLPREKAAAEALGWTSLNGDSDEWNWSHFNYAIISEPVGPEEVWFTVINGSCDAGPYNYECTEVYRAQDYGGQPVRYVRDDLAGGKG